MILHYLAIVAPSGLVVYQKSFSNVLNTSSLLGGLLTTIIVAGHRTVEGSLTYVEGLHACLSIHRQSNVMCLLFHEKCHKRVLSEMFGQLLTQRFLRAFLEEYGAELESGSLGHFVLGSFAAFDFRVLSVLHNTIRSLLRNLQTQPYVRSVILTYDDGTVESTQASDLTEKNLRFPIRVHQSHKPVPNIQPFRKPDRSPLHAIAEDYEEGTTYVTAPPSLPEPETLPVLPTQDISVTSSCRPLLSIAEELMSTLSDTLMQISITTEIFHPAEVRNAFPSSTTALSTTWRPQYTLEKGPTGTGTTTLHREKRTNSKSFIERPLDSENILPKRARKLSSLSTAGTNSDEGIRTAAPDYRVSQPSFPQTFANRPATTGSAPTLFLPSTALPNPSPPTIQSVPFRTRNIVYRVPGGLLIVTGMFVRASAERLRRDILMNWLIGDTMRFEDTGGKSRVLGPLGTPSAAPSPVLADTYDTEDTGYVSHDRFMFTNPTHTGVPRETLLSNADPGSVSRTEFTEKQADVSRQGKPTIMKKVRSLFRRLPFVHSKTEGQGTIGQPSTSGRTASIRASDSRGTPHHDGTLANMATTQRYGAPTESQVPPIATFSTSKRIAPTEDDSSALQQKPQPINSRLFFSLPSLIAILRSASPYYQYQILYTLSDNPASLSESILASPDFALLVVTLQVIRQYTGFDAGGSTVFY